MGVSTERQRRQPSAPVALVWTGRGAVHVNDDRSAALLVRVWTEGGGAFRCRLVAIDTSPGTGPAEERTLAVTSSPGEAMATVREWLDRFLSAGAVPIDTD